MLHEGQLLCFGAEELQVLLRAVGRISQHVAVFVTQRCVYDAVYLHGEIGGTSEQGDSQSTLHDVEHSQVDGFRLASESPFYYIHRVVVGKYRSRDKARKQGQCCDEQDIDNNGGGIEIARNVKLGVKQVDSHRFGGFGKEEAYDKRNQCEQC